MKPVKLSCCFFSYCFLLLACTTLSGQQVDSLAEARKKILVHSSIDGTIQPSYLYVPLAVPPGKKIPLVVLLHTWSNDLEQRFKELEDQVSGRGWFLLEPNFRGRNDHPEACGSALAQRDILDAVSWVQKHYSINRNQVYLVGFSGGGYLTMLMAALHPKPWAAASAWCGISDLSHWYDLHQNDPYGQMMRQCFGGPPGQSDSIALQFRNRSPITHLNKPTPVPLDIAAGRSDSIVPPIHSINAFNTLVRSVGYPGISKEGIERALKVDSVNSQTSTRDAGIDSIIGRRIFLRTQEGKYRITIYEGKHEWMPVAAMEWCDKYYKKRKRKMKAS